MLKILARFNELRIPHIIPGLNLSSKNIIYFRKISNFKISLIEKTHGIYTPVFRKKAIGLFTHLFHRYLLSIYYVPTLFYMLGIELRMQTVEFKAV